jgi:hypothetical protein
LSLDENPFPIKDALLVALDMPSVEWKEEYGPKEEVRQPFFT